MSRETVNEVCSMIEMVSKATRVINQYHGMISLRVKPLSRILFASCRLEWVSQNIGTFIETYRTYE